MPLLTPPRYQRFALLGLLVAGAAGLVEATQESSANGLRAFLAAALGWAVVGLALSLPGLTVRGLLLGGFFVGAGILSWSFSESPGVVWGFLVVEGAVFATWTFPWLRDLAKLPKLGGAWLGLAYWFLGTLGALLNHPLVSVQRIVYGGLFTLGALAVLSVIRRTRTDPTPAIAAAFLLALGVLLLVGSGNALDDVHAVPGTAWGNNMAQRFWGGPFFLYHPNSIALISVLVALRIAPDRAFAVWQRAGVLGTSFLMLLLVTSRTAWGFAVAAALVHAWLVFRKRVDHAGSGRRAVVTVLVPFVLLVALMIGSGGPQWLVYNRYPNSSAGSDLTSGRTQTWKKVIEDFKGDTIAEKLFGNGDDARGTVTRADSVEDPNTTPPKLTTDNAFFGALRRGGMAGVAAFLLGLVLVLRRALSRDAAPWFTITAVAALPTIATSDWVLGGTGGTLWILLLAAEAWQVYRPTDEDAPVTG
ncbi:O-antigen ligase family protein [Longispora sp. NPDC051575]|uniref:O-antigen ligase family protein n=1 Tax=Longispora sp. NPDC051575 TaxID=3154943 RepID=UPI00341AD54D